MRPYGPLDVAGAEQLSTDPTTELFEGRVYYNTSTEFLKVYANAAWRDIVDLNQAQTLLNKSLTSPTINTGATFLNQATAFFREPTGAGTNAVGIKGPDTLASDYNFKLPLTQGSAGQVLMTDGGSPDAQLGYTNVLTSTDGGLSFSRTSTGNRTVTTGNVLLFPEGIIDTGHTYTINSGGFLHATGSLTITGTLDSPGTTRIIA